MKWEYLVRKYRDIEDLNVYGQQGWELCGIRTTKRDSIHDEYIFKRPLPLTSPEPIVEDGGSKDRIGDELDNLLDEFYEEGHHAQAINKKDAIRQHVKWLINENVRQAISQHSTPEPKDKLTELEDCLIKEFGNPPNCPHSIEMVFGMIKALKGEMQR